ncbi:gamma-glutamylcyclotransferase family protein [Pseudofrankia sp. BMG5.37]|nr:MULTISPECIES: gamma-glutamylcyclotransferase family protein [unclassified Pseudofrankia]MDT3439540.1 gamma-glutamylcyclotransferase family protein [Pseudofrankia sp. BMG5.37]
MTDVNMGARQGVDDLGVGLPHFGNRSGMVRMFVNGQAMSGGSIHAPLADAEFLGRAWTAPRYRFWSFRDEFPGLEPVTADGWSVPGELYAVSYAVLRDRLLPLEPPELELAVIELADGGGSLSMRVRAGAQADAVEIRHPDGWLGHLAARRTS